MGALFFGLWLIPMGYLVLASQDAAATRLDPHRRRSWVHLECLRGLSRPRRADSVELLTALATGEFWMIGYLLIKGVRGDLRAHDGPGVSPFEPTHKRGPRDDRDHQQRIPRGRRSVGGAPALHAEARECLAPRAGQLGTQLAVDYLLDDRWFSHEANALPP